MVWIRHLAVHTSMSRETDVHNCIGCIFYINRRQHSLNDWEKMDHTYAVSLTSWLIFSYLLIVIIRFACNANSMTYSALWIDRWLTEKFTYHPTLYRIYVGLGDEVVCFQMVKHVFSLVSFVLICYEWGCGTVTRHDMMSTWQLVIHGQN